MAKYDKYICTELKKRHMLPGPTPEERDKLAAEGLRISMEHVLWIDDEVIPGAYYGESTWIWPSSYPNQISWADMMKRSSNNKPMFPHAHDFPELLSWWGTDPDNPEDTTSMGMLMDDEEIPLDRSWIAYIPAGMMHMPTITPGGKISTRPVCHWTSGPGGVYTRERDKESTKSENGKEGEFKRSKSTHSTPRSEARGMLRVDTERRFLPQFKNQGLAPSNVSKPRELRNAKYIVFGNKQSAKMPPYMREIDPKYTRPMAYIDETVIHGAEFGCDTRWLLPGEKSKAGQLMMDAHALPHGTSIVFNAMNYEDITDLCAEVELWIGGEKHMINKSFGAYIPPDVKQGPMIIRNITRQIFFMMSYPIGEGIKKYRGR